MKKRIIAAALAALMAAGVLAGCASKNPAYLSGIKASDYVDLPDYSAIPVEEAAPSVSDDYLDMYIQYMLSADSEYVEVTDHDTVREGDTVNIDYVGKKDGEAFDGGSDSGYNLTIGSGTFIDGFEDGLIGKKVGATVDLNLTFPDDYSNEDLAGQDVVFTVTINKIVEKQTPELTDEYVAGKGLDGVETVDQFREYYRDQLMEQAQSSYDSDVQNQVIQYMSDNSTFKQDPPTEMVDRLNESLTNTYTTYAQYYGMDLKSFMEQQGFDEDSYEDEIKDRALTTAKQYIIMQAVADEQKLNPSKRDLKTALSREAASAGYSSIQEFEKNEDADAYAEYLTIQNALDYLTEHAVVTEPSADDTTEDAEAADSAAESGTEAAAEAATEAAAEAATEAAK